MKKILFIGTAAAVLAAASASAQPGRGDDRVIDRAQVESRVGTMFARVDADRDGFVTEAEAESARAAVRARRSEQRGVRQQQRGERRAALFARLDADGNGVISRAEFDAPRAGAGNGEARAQQRPARMERRGHRSAQHGQRGGGRFGAQAFARMDADGDGRVSLAEATRFRLERFDRVDANDDGRITVEERQAVRAGRQGR